MSAFATGLRNTVWAKRREIWPEKSSKPIWPLLTNVTVANHFPRTGSEFLVASAMVSPEAICCKFVESNRRKNPFMSGPIIVQTSNMPIKPKVISMLLDSVPTFLRGKRPLMKSKAHDLPVPAWPMMCQNSSHLSCAPCGYSRDPSNT